MNNSIRKILTRALVTLSLVLLPTGSALAATTKGAIQCGVNGAAGVSDCTAQPTNSLDNTVSTIINILSAVVGAAAVIMIILAGLRYVTSGGNQESVASAKRSIIYAIVGLVIVAFAQIIVHYVIKVAK